MVRETTASGDWVADSESVVRLPRRKFRKVETSLIASATGNVIDVYVYRSGSIRPGESFMTDAISLAVEPPAEEPPVEEPPAEEPPAEEPPAEEPPAEEPPVPSSPLTTSQVALITSHEDPLFEEDGSKYAYIMIRDSLHYRLEELRQVHPEAKILLYKNVAFTLVDPGCRWAPFQGGGVHYCEADTHENWFLHHKTTGERLVSSGYASQRAMDIGNPNYRQAWISSVLDRVTDAQADGSNARYDGVWMDDSNLYPGHGMDGQIAGMTDTQYRQRMVEFIEMAASELEQAGVLSVLNLGMNPWEADQRAAAIDVAGDVSMINREGLVRWGEGTTWTDPDGDAPFWDDEIALAEDIQAAGAKFHAMTYGTSNDVQIQRYARATFLMAWDGTEGSAFNFRTSDGGEWTSEWTTDVGRPTEARRRVGQGWRRDFTGGTVVINTRGSGSQTFNLGASYELPGGNCTTSVTLAATRAMVLPSC